MVSYEVQGQIMLAINGELSPAIDMVNELVIDVLKSYGVLKVHMYYGVQYVVNWVCS